MKYRFGIPSYKRADSQLTLETLKKLGYAKNEIVISTQTKQDFTEYKHRYDDSAIILFRAAENDSQNRNTLIDYFGEGECFLLVDDDIRAFSKLKIEPNGTKTLRRFERREELEATFDKMFRYCKAKRSPLWAWYPVDNAFYMSDTVDDRNILVGTIFGVINSHRLKFDETYDLKGDYEISLRLMQIGLNAVRFNGYTAEARHKSTGGCEDARKAGKNKEQCAKLLLKYPELIKPSHRTGEIRFVGKRGTDK